MNFNTKRIGIAALAAVMLTGGCGFHRKKYENPITKDTEQPDKVLFDKAVNDIEKGRYEVARLTLNTLINTYDSSEFLAKAKLAIADSWMRQSGAEGFAQAEAEYKDFQLFLSHYGGSPGGPVQNLRHPYPPDGEGRSGSRERLCAPSRNAATCSQNIPTVNSLPPPSSGCARSRKRWRRPKWWPGITITTRARWLRRPTA